MAAEDRAPETPRYRGKCLKSDVRRLGARLWREWLRSTLATAGVSNDYLAERLGVDTAWVSDVLRGDKLPAASDAFVLPRSLKVALATALLNSAANDHG